MYCTFLSLFFLHRVYDILAILVYIKDNGDIYLDSILTFFNIHVYMIMLLVESCLAPRTAKLELAGSNITPNGLDSDYMNLFICQACKIVNAEVSLKTC